MMGMFKLETGVLTAGYSQAGDAHQLFHRDQYVPLHLCLIVGMLSMSR
jgi:hypothetical protein